MAESTNTNEQSDREFDLTIKLDERPPGGVSTVELIEGEPTGGEESYHNRIWNIPFGCDTRRAAAEIASYADRRIAELEARLELLRKSEAGTLAQMAETNERFDGALSKITELEAQLAEAKARAADLAKVLEQVEWVWVASQNQNEPADLICPWCKQRKGHPWHRNQDVDHKPDCARQAALNPDARQEGAREWPVCQCGHYELSRSTSGCGSGDCKCVGFNPQSALRQSEGE